MPELRTTITGGEFEYNFVGGALPVRGQGIPTMPQYVAPLAYPQGMREILGSADLTRYLVDDSEDFIAPVFGYAISKQLSTDLSSMVRIYQTTWLDPYVRNAATLQDSRRVYAIDQGSENLFKNRMDLSDQSKKLMYPANGTGELRFGDTHVLFFRSPYVTAPSTYVDGAGINPVEVGISRFNLPDEQEKLSLRPIYYSGMIYAYDTPELADQAFTTADPALYERYTASSTGREFIKLTDLGLSEYAKTIEDLFWPLDRGLSTRVHSKYTRK